MKTDFLDAQARHLEDADLLREGSRLANADHLYGLAAECGLKALMKAFGMPFEEARGLPSRPQDRKHIDEIWKRYDRYRRGRVGPKYELPRDNPFADWHVSQRYAPRSAFDALRVARHAEAAHEVYQLVGLAQMEGHI